MRRLSDEHWDLLSQSASRLRVASRWVVLACERQDLAVPPSLSEWPNGLRGIGGWARTTEGDQAEDEHLHGVIDAGRRTVLELDKRAPLDPTVRLARSAFEAAGDRYERDSHALHEAYRDPSLSVADSAAALHTAVSVLLRSVREAEQIERSMLAARLVPPPLAVAANRLLDCLVVFGEPPDESSNTDPAQRLLARELDGTLGVIAERPHRCPESVLLAAENAAATLDAWDRATGSFRTEDDLDRLGHAPPTVAATPAYDAAAPEAQRRAQAEAELSARLHLAVDGADAAGAGHGVLAGDALGVLVREHRALGDGYLAPIGLVARDDVYRDHATRASVVLAQVAADHLDSVDSAELSLGRAALHAHEAAIEYVAASNALADRVRRDDIGPWTTSQSHRLDVIAETWREVETLCAGRAIGDVPKAEITALNEDLRRALLARRDGSSADVVTGFDRRLADTVRGLADGSTGTDLARLRGGNRVLAHLDVAGRDLDATLGVRRPPSPTGDAAVEQWLAKPAPPPARPTETGYRNVSAAQVELPRQHEASSGRIPGPW